MTIATLDRDPLTEREVLAAARSIRELQALRDLKAHQGTAGIKVGTVNVPLENDELQGILALLIERHTILLASLGIETDR